MLIDCSQPLPAVHGQVLSLECRSLVALEKAMGAIGKPEFYAAAFDLVSAVAGTDCGGVIEYFGDSCPHFHLYRTNNAARNDHGARPYQEGRYLFCPLYRVFLSGAPDGAYRLHDHVSEDFVQSEFSESFFAHTEVIDSIDVLWRLDDNSSLAIIIEREAGEAAFASQDLAAVKQVLPILFSALRRHHQLAVAANQSTEDLAVHRKVQSAFDNFAASVLTRRERDVLFLMLSGYSVAATARRLGTAEATVRVHRKSIHRKLEVESQVEVFSLFIRCIPFATPDEPRDPLLRYQNL